VHDVFADVPLANMFNYVNVMRSLGRADFTMRFGRYALLPRAQEAKIVAQCA
jgi:translation elongation factor EF-G